MAYDINIVSTGSSGGNCYIIDDHIMIDCGVSFRSIEKCLEDIQILLVSHEHSDHLNPSVISGIDKQFNYLLKHGCYLNRGTIAHLQTKKPDIVMKYKDDIHTLFPRDEFEIRTFKGKYLVETFRCPHGEVENQGFIITNNLGEKLLFATDTETMRFAPLYKYDYLLLEGNYDEDALEEAKFAGTGDLSYDLNSYHRAMRNSRHLSIQDFEDFVRNNTHQNSIVYQLHESAEFGKDTKLEPLSKDKLGN